MTRPPGAKRPCRRGFTVFELAMAVMLLAVAMTLTAQLLGAIALERRSVARRALATREVANMMEHLAARPWEHLSTEALKDVQLSTAAQQALPGADLNLSVEDSNAADLPAKRIAIRLRWRNRAGELDAPVRLTSWVYRQPSGRSAP